MRRFGSDKGNIEIIAVYSTPVVDAAKWIIGSKDGLCMCGHYDGTVRSIEIRSMNNTVCVPIKSISGKLLGMGGHFIDGLNVDRIEDGKYRLMIDAMVYEIDKTGMIREVI